MKDSKNHSAGPATNEPPALVELRAKAASLSAAGRAALSRIASQAGKTLGVGAGVAVTEGLRLAPGWNKPVVDDHGKPVDSVPGAQREGDHDILKRDEEVVGPEIAALAKKIPPGLLHDFVAGFGAGATEAPGDTYRIDNKIDDAMGGKKS